MFPAWHIAVTAFVTAIVTSAGTVGWRWRASGRTSLRAGDLIAVGVASGLGVLLWRLGANAPTLNNDSIPGVSPADVLSAPLAFVAAEVYIRLRRTSELFSIAPAVAALVALLVNIVTI